MFIYRKIVLALLFLSNSALAQFTPEGIKEFISTDSIRQVYEIHRPAQLNEFYITMAYSPAWLKPGDRANVLSLLEWLRTASSHGLDPKDYQYDFINAFIAGSVSLRTGTDSLAAEIKISDAAICFFYDWTYGKTRPSFKYNGLSYTPSCLAIPQLLAGYCKTNNLAAMQSQLIIPLAEVSKIEEMLQWFQQMRASPSFTEQKIISTTIDDNNKPLLKKLYYLGFLEYADTTPIIKIKEALKDAQRQLDLLPDGILNNATLKQLNIPVQERIERLISSLNDYRWLYCLTLQQPVVVVNIPAAYMKVYHHGSVILEMKMIVGKRSTPTPTLNSRIHEVVLYPYWMVPNSIATKELLPSIKKNPGFLDANNYQVLDRQARIVDPATVNWENLSSSNFPYIIRQSTGCDNALGLIKLNFYSSFSVYLHDTPVKSLFSRNKRFFSHGCMRMEKPMELGHLVLNNNPLAIDTLEEKGCLRNQAPVIVPADQKLPIIVWYNPVGIDSTGRIVFYTDIYNRFGPKKSP